MREAWGVLVAVGMSAALMGCPSESKAPEGEKPMSAPAGSAASSAPASGEAPASAPAGSAAEPASAAGEEAKTATPDGNGGLLVKSEAYKVKFTVPEGWQVDKSPTSISASSPDQKILMVVAGSKSQDLAEAALNDLKKNLKFKDVNLDKQGTTTFNGLIGLRGEGDATLVNEDGTEERMHFVGFTTKIDEQAITVAIFSAKETYDEKITLIEGVLGTLDKL